MNEIKRNFIKIPANLRTLTASVTHTHIHLVLDLSASIKLKTRVYKKKKKNFHRYLQINRDQRGTTFQRLDPSREPYRAFGTAFPRSIEIDVYKDI